MASESDRLWTLTAALILDRSQPGETKHDGVFLSNYIFSLENTKREDMARIDISHSMRMHDLLDYVGENVQWEQVHKANGNILHHLIPFVLSF